MFSFSGHACDLIGHCFLSQPIRDSASRVKKKKNSWFITVRINIYIDYNKSLWMLFIDDGMRMEKNDPTTAMILY